jgi:Mor family transcriptional regulator
MNTIDEIGDLLGPEVAESLKQKYPGQRIWVPGTITTSHKLAGLGLEVAKRLSYYYGGCRFRVPPVNHTVDRDEQIYRDWERGLSPREMKEIYGISERSIYKARERHRARMEADRC